MTKTKTTRTKKTQQSRRTIDKLLVPQKDEQKYCENHEIIFKRLKNGSFIVAAAHNAKASVDTTINFQIPSGAVFDPKGKEGLHHMLEHLFNQPTHTYAIENDCSLNARTGSLDIFEILTGPANLKVRNFGVWNLIAPVVSLLKSPLLRRSSLKKIIVREKQVIESEISKLKANHNWQVRNTLNKWLFSTNNPINSFPPGSVDTISSITTSDLSKLVKKVLIPHGLVTTIFSEADFETINDLSTLLESELSKFPRKRKKKQNINWKSRDLTNKNLRKVVQYKTPVNNKIVSLVLVWPITHPPFSEMGFALNRLKNILWQKIFSLSRSEGWSYTTECYVLRSSETTGYFIIRIDLPNSKKYLNKKHVDTLKQKIRKACALNKKQILKLASLEKKRQLAWPISLQSHLHWMSFAINKHNRLINLDLILKRYLEVNQRHFTPWINLITQRKSLTALIGDLP